MKESKEAATIRTVTVEYEATVLNRIYGVTEALGHDDVSARRGAGAPARGAHCGAERTGDGMSEQRDESTDDGRLSAVETLHLVNELGRDGFGIDTPAVEVVSLALFDGVRFTGPEHCRLKVNGVELGPRFAPQDAELAVTFFLLGVRIANNGE